MYLFYFIFHIGMLYICMYILYIHTIIYIYIYIYMYIIYTYNYIYIYICIYLLTVKPKDYVKPI